MGKYGVLKVRNTAAEPMTLYVKDPDGNEHIVTTLAPGQETTQFTPLGAAWDLRPASASAKSIGAEDALDLDDDGKGGDKAIGG